MICKKCKEQLQDSFAFCPYCGAKVKQENEKPRKGVKKRGNGQGTVFKQKGKWIAQVTIGWRPDGRRISLSKTFEKKTDAIQALPTLKLEYSPSTVKKTISFEDCFEKMMVTHRKGINDKTAESYYFVFKHFEPIYNIPIADIKTATLQECVDSGNSGSMRQKMKAIASLTFKYAMANDVVEKNYAEFINVGRESREEVEPFNKAEIKTIFDSISSVPYADIIAILILTGMRPGELFDLKQENYHGTYFIGGIKTAAGKNRTIPIPTSIQPVVEKYANQNHEFIFTSAEGKKMDLSHFRSRCYYPALEQMGVRKLNPYACRHTFATLMKAVDAPITDKQKLMGHSSFSMTAYYTHSDIESLEHISNEIANQVEQY